MTSFTAQGHRGSDTVQITWTDGTLSGDPFTVAMLQALATGYDGDQVGGAPGGYTTHDHLSNPWSTWMLMHLIFSDTPRVVAGALPLIPAPPEGQIA